ncbi:unnamed protein product [Linum tenue]|uniref:S-protein homolog n=1 Tax=Linum tenue TaxID=586396 RepID=A0AAV0IC38_9ROSI|nr:unnamed protein product [Linum tenue]
MTTVRSALGLAAVVLATVLVQVSTTDYFTIRVNNKLSSKKAVIVHCKSGDDDLHAHAVVTDFYFDWGFGGVLETVYWCRLAFQDKRLGFTAFNGEDEFSHKTYVADFDVYDDGVFGTEVKSGKRLRFAEWH